MPCLNCTQNQNSYSESYRLEGNTHSKIVGYEKIVQKGNIVFEQYDNYVIECTTCQQVWIIKSGPVHGDPREQAPPEYYEQHAYVANEVEKELVINPIFENILQYNWNDSRFPYKFLETWLTKAAVHDQEGLIKAYEKKDSGLYSTVKQWLEEWIRTQLPEEYNRINAQGTYDGFTKLTELETTIGIEKACIIDDFYTAVCFEGNENQAEKKGWHIRTYSIKEGKQLWTFPLPDIPFTINEYAPFFYIQHNFILSLQISNPNNGEKPEVAKPNRLIILDLQGNLVFKGSVYFFCYALDPEKEKEYSEPRIVNNFNTTIIDSILYYPDQYNIVGYDLIKKEEVVRIRLKGKDIFSGKAEKLEDGSICCYMLKGVFTLKNHVIDYYYSIELHPLFINKRHIQCFYYSIVLDAKKGTKLEIKEGKHNQVTQRLHAPPIQNSKGLILICTWGSTFFINENLEIVKKHAQKSNDILSSYSHKKVAVILFDDHFVIAENNHLCTFNELGEIHSQKDLDGEIIHMIARGSSLFVVVDSNNGFGKENSYTVYNFNKEIKELSKVKLKFLEGFAIGDANVMVVKKEKYIMKKI